MEVKREIGLKVIYGFFTMLQRSRRHASHAPYEDTMPKKSAEPIRIIDQTTNTPMELVADIVFESAPEKGATKIKYSARVTFLSTSSMLPHAMEHVKWSLQSMARDGKFPAGRKVEVMVGDEIVLKRTAEDEVSYFMGLSESAKQLYKDDLQRKIEALQALQGV